MLWQLFLGRALRAGNEGVTNSLPTVKQLGSLTRRRLYGLLVRLEASKGCHKIIDLAGRRVFTGFEVALNAQSGEEGQHHLGNCGRSHLGLFGFDVHGEKALHAWMKISNAMPPSWMR
jgi:hypothetical protein